MNHEFYLKDGVEYDRVTKVLDYFALPQLVAWKVKVGSKEARRQGTTAKKIGTNVDEWIKADIMGNRYPKLINLEAKNCVEAYNKWKKDYKIKTSDVKAGETVYDDENKVAGTPDLWRYEECIDVKCSVAIRPAYWLQVNWYAFQRISTQSRSILRLDKNLAVYEYEVKPVSIHEIDVFNGLLKAYRFFNQQESLTEGKGEEDVNDIDSGTAEEKTDTDKDMDKTEVSDVRPGGDW